MSMTRRVLRTMITCDENGALQDVSMVVRLLAVSPDNEDMVIEKDETVQVQVEDLNAGDLTAFRAALARGKTLVRRVKPMVKT